MRNEFRAKTYKETKSVLLLWFFYFIKMAWLVRSKICTIRTRISLNFVLVASKVNGQRFDDTFDPVHRIG